MNGFRCALAMFSGRIILNFGISERLRAFRYPIFTGGVVEKNSICSATFCESAALQENLLPAFSRLNRYVTIFPLRPLCVKMCLEHSAECDKRKNKNNRTAIYAQSTAEGILNRFYLAASNSASISAEGAGVTRLTTTQTTREIRKAGSSS